MHGQLQQFLNCYKHAFWSMLVVDYDAGRVQPAIWHKKVHCTNERRPPRSTFTDAADLARHKRGYKHIILGFQGFPLMQTCKNQHVLRGKCLLVLVRVKAIL